MRSYAAYAKEKQDNLEYMKGCCDEEIKLYEKGEIPAPFYFERVAILSRKEGNLEQEIQYCEKYIDMVENYYKKHGTEGRSDVREGPRYKSILKRIPKAKELLQKKKK